MANPIPLAGLVQPITAVTAASGAATGHGTLVRVTTAALTTAAGVEYTLTLTNSYIGENSTVLVAVKDGTNTQATMATGEATTASGSVVITVTNTHASEALNGTIIIDALVINPK